MTYNHQEQKNTNATHLVTPTPGDYWEERFCPILTVLEARPETVVIIWHVGKGKCDPKKDAIEITHATFRKKVCYRSDDPTDLSTYCDVHPGRQRNLVDAWVAAGKPTLDRTYSGPDLYYAEIQRLDLGVLCVVNSVEALQLVMSTLEMDAYMFEFPQETVTYPATVLIHWSGKYEFVMGDTLAQALTDAHRASEMYNQQKL